MSKWYRTKELARRKICNTRNLGRYMRRFIRGYLYHRGEKDFGIVVEDEKVFIPYELLRDRNLINPFFGSVEEDTHWQLAMPKSYFWFFFMSKSRNEVNDVGDKEFILKYMELERYAKIKWWLWYKLTTYIFKFLKQIICQKRNIN